VTPIVPSGAEYTGSPDAIIYPNGQVENCSAFWKTVGEYLAGLATPDPARLIAVLDEWEAAGLNAGDPRNADYLRRALAFLSAPAVAAELQRQGERVVEVEFENGQRQRMTQWECVNLPADPPHYVVY
jgi:hypothetical protein